MSDSNNFWEQLLILRATTERLGILHEAQCVQLRAWPIALFPHIIGCEAQVNIETKTINFKLQYNKNLKPPTDVSKRYKLLDNSVKDMLGPAWLIKIKQDNEILYRGKRVDNDKGTDKAAKSKSRRAKSSAKARRKGRS